MTMQRELDLFGLEKRRLRDYVTKTNTAEKGVCKLDASRLFLQVQSGRPKGNGLMLQTRKMFFDKYIVCHESGDAL